MSDVVDGDDMGARLQALLSRRFASHTPGVTIGVFRDGAVLARASVGRARIDSDTPLSSETVMDVASVSKQFTAAIVVMLDADGLLALDDEVRDYVPKVRTPGVTIRHCLQHTSGLPDYLGVSDLLGSGAERGCGRAEFLRFIGTVHDPDFPPGSDIAYSNTGYVLAALAAERATGEPWPGLLSRLVFGPLGMSSTIVRSTLESAGPRVAHGYDATGAPQFARDEWGTSGLPPGSQLVAGDGEVLTTIDDLAAWHGFLADGRVLGVDVRRSMLERTVLGGGRSTPYGMGLWWEDVSDAARFGHSGSFGGFRAYSITDVATGAGVAVLANRSDVDAAALARQALIEVVDHPRVSGVWMTETPLHHVEIRSRPDGGLTLAEDGATYELWRDDAGWRGHGPVRRLERRGDELRAEDAVGRRIDLLRCSPLAEVSAMRLAGEYASTGQDIRVSVVPDGAGGASLRMGSRGPHPIRPIGASVAGDLYTAGPFEVLVHPAPGSAMTVGNGVASITVTRLPGMPAETTQDSSRRST